MEQERRQFYRIDHPVILEYRVVTESEVAGSPQPYQFDVSPYFLLQSQLAEIDNECQHLLYKVAESTPHLATYLQSLNKKIDLIGRTLSYSGIETESAQPYLVNLSEGGISFSEESPIELGSYLALKLIFPDNGLGLLLYARVQRCLAAESGYDIGVSFMKMSESCRTLLARLIIEAQARERKRQNDAG